MPLQPQVLPLPRKKRRITFIVFFVIFVASLPFLYLYATGYRFHLGEEANIVATGGMYIAAERTGAEIYIDGELVRETRVFRKAFYAQNLEVGTHRIHVQKAGHHTWVKELPVSKHLVTEAQAFNLTLVPQVRVIAPYVSATGTQIVTTELIMASTTNEIVATTTKLLKPSVHVSQNPEFISLKELFSTTSTSSSALPRKPALERVEEFFTATSSAATTTPATTTKEWGGARLYENSGEVYARWIGERENIPYYYCAPEFPPYSTSTQDLALAIAADNTGQSDATEEAEDPEAAIHPVQTVPLDVPCDPMIRMDRKGQALSGFDFYPGADDLVLLSLEDGIYVAEIDDRSWQNVQPLVLGKKLTMHVSNGQIYVYDGHLIYQILLEEY